MADASPTVDKILLRVARRCSQRRQWRRHLRGNTARLRWSVRRDSGRRRRHRRASMAFQAIGGRTLAAQGVDAVHYALHQLQPQLSESVADRCPLFVHREGNRLKPGFQRYVSVHP